MEYIFSTAAQALQASGQALPVFNAVGQALPLLRDPNTGRFVAMALQGGTALATGGTVPAVVSVLGSTAGMVMQSQQNRQILSALSEVQTSLGVLQASTAVIGVGTVASVALGAVNLWQTLKLRDEVKRLGVQIQDSFITIERTIMNQSNEIREQIDRVAKDVIFAQHRLELIKAYNLFQSGIERIQVASTQKEIENRRLTFANAIQDLSNALSIYRSPHILSENNAPGYLRRLECSWQIRQALVISFQIQGELESAISELIKLQAEIKSGLIEVLDCCSTSDELEFIFPEIHRIQTVDLPNFAAWQMQLEWWGTLSLKEQYNIQLLLNDELLVQVNSDAINERSGLTTTVIEPAECQLYREYIERTTPLAIHEFLYLLIDEQRRSTVIEAIVAASQERKLPALTPSVLELASNLSIANILIHNS